VVGCLPEMVGVSEDALEIGGGTAFVTPVPNLPEFKICNAQGACQKEVTKVGLHVTKRRECVNTFFTCGVGGPATPLVVVV
jgi:hypothetical protein